MPTCVAALRLPVRMIVERLSECWWTECPDGVECANHYKIQSRKAVQPKNLKSMTFAVIQHELTLTLTLTLTPDFPHPISRYYIACTSPTDRALQGRLITLNHERAAAGLFQVELVFWDRLTEIMNANPGLHEDYTGIPGISAQVMSLGQVL